MEPVKRQVMQVFRMMLAASMLDEALHEAVILNFTFLGNPGTGKTTVARIFGQLLYEVGARTGVDSDGNPVFSEKTAMQLKREGSTAFANTVESALGGVLARVHYIPINKFIELGM